jgi:eukaryotic-like serine/threonine-protein kinase
MPLSAGDKLGPYEIVSRLGKGGMGEVWKARDPRLGRDVAIKVSAQQFTNRFERETRAGDALNHPHICHIYDVGPDYLVMELVEGVPIGGPIPTDEALKYADQILDALVAAHRRGIVHRDLKPGNILLSKQGIKLLDFGLAQMKPDPNGSFAETMTQTGAVMGTPGYMAPEQWEGKQADARTDIYSFGWVLYEMLTGKRAAVNQATGDRTTVAPRLEDILRTCLEKDPDERWQSARELKHALRWAGVLEPERSTAAALRSRFGMAGWIAAGVLACALAAVSFVHLRESPLPEQTLRANIAAPEGSTVHSFAISPDGRYLVFAAAVSGKEQLWLRAIIAPQAQPMPFTEDAVYPFWSPDSRFIGFFAQGKLKKVAAAGGPAQSLCDVPSSRGGSWSRDNVIVFSPNNSGISIQRVSAGGGTPVDVTRTKGVQRHPVFLPDGRHFLYLVRNANAPENGIYVSSLDGNENRRVLPDASGAAFAPPARGNGTGHILFVRENTLMAAPFDATSAQLAGDVFPVADHVSLITPNSYLPVSVSADGLLLYATRGADSGATQMGWYDRTGKSLGQLGAPGAVSNPAISPDEKLVVFQRATSSGGDLWVRDLNRGGETRLTSDPSSNVAPFWSPRGDRIVFASNRTGVYNLYQKAADGAAADRKPIPFLRSEFEDLLGQLSPDSQWMTFTSDRSGRREVYVRPFRLGEGEWTISVAGGEASRWSGDGKELFYEAADGKMMAVPVKKAVPGARPVFEPGAPVALFDAHMRRDADVRHFEYDVTADGKRFLVNVAETGSAVSAPPLTVVTNWLAATRR